MSFDLHISIPENSPIGQIVQRIVSTDRVTPEQAVTRILTEAASKESEKNPAQRMIGLFSSDEDAALMDEVMELVAESRKSHSTRDIGL